MLVQNGMCAKKINKNVTPTSHPCQKIERLNTKKNHFQGTPTPTVLIRTYFESTIPYFAIFTTYQKHPANNWCLSETSSKSKHCLPPEVQA